MTQNSDLHCPAVSLLLWHRPAQGWHCTGGPVGRPRPPLPLQALGTWPLRGRGGGREQRETHGTKSPRAPWKRPSMRPQDGGQPSPHSAVVPWMAPGQVATHSTQVFPTCHLSRHSPEKSLFKVAPDSILGIVPSVSRRPTAGPSPWWPITRLTTPLPFSFLQAALPRLWE